MKGRLGDIDGILMNMVDGRKKRGGRKKQKVDKKKGSARLNGHRFCGIAKGHWHRFSKKKKK